MADTIFRSGDIEITTSLAKFGSASYPIANIGSIVVTERAQSHVLASFVVALIIFLLVAAFVNESAAAVVGIAIFVGLLVLARKAGANFTLTLRTSSGDVNALTSKDRGLVLKVKDAIENAVGS